MKKSLCKRLKMTIFSPAMLVSVSIGFLLLIRFRIHNYVGYNMNVGSITLKEMGGVFLDDIYMAHTRNGFSLFSPILAVMPATILFCEDYNSGYIKSILSRMEKKRYTRETFICTTISGGLVIFLPCFFASLFFLINGKLNTVENMIGGYSTAFDETVYSDLQYVWGGILLAVLLLVLSFLFGAVWSGVGLLVSSLITNRYLALAMPFVIYFSMHLLFYRSDILLVFSPANMLMPSAAFIPYKAYPFVYQFILLGIVASLYGKTMERRLWDA